MIIPKLHDSTYEVVIGFAKNSFPEQLFSIPVNKKDKGFQLKNLGEKGWALVNLQNMSVIMNAAVSREADGAIVGTRKTDAFSEMLANVVNDSSILYTVAKKDPEPVAKTEAIVAKPAVKNQNDNTVPGPETQPNNAVTQEPAIKKDSTPAAQTITSNGTAEITSKTTDTPANTSSVASAPTAKNDKTATAENVTTTEQAGVEKPFITRIDEKKTTDSYQATYLEQYTLTTDTIKITIPLAEGAFTPTPSPVIPKNDSTPVVTNTAEDKIISPKTVIADTAARSKALLITNSDCKNFASDYDLDKLRVKLISDKTIDDKITSSKKFFKYRCMSVKQVRALAEIFPSDETKYRFFDIAYPFVSDTSNFYQLEELIENNYYKNRFKAMIPK